MCEEGFEGLACQRSTFFLNVLQCICWRGALSAVIAVCRVDVSRCPFGVRVVPLLEAVISFQYFIMLNTNACIVISFMFDAQ